MEEEKVLSKDNSWDGGFWAILIFLMIFGFGPSADHQTREEVAELKGKVSVLEKVLLSDRRA